MNALVNLFYKRPRLEAALSAIDKTRLKLPLISISRLFAGFDEHPVVLTDLPLGPWSSPVADTVILHELADERPVAAIEGSWLAVHAPAWSTPAGGARLASASLASSIDAPGADPWAAENLRG